MKKCLIAFLIGSVFVFSNCVFADAIEVEATDETPTAPLPNPSPGAHQPRYISGFGSGDTFTLLFEDREKDYQIW